MVSFRQIKWKPIVAKSCWFEMSKRRVFWIFGHCLKWRKQVPCSLNVDCSCFSFHLHLAPYDLKVFHKISIDQWMKPKLRITPVFLLDDSTLQWDSPFLQSSLQLLSSLVFIFLESWNCQISQSTGSKTPKCHIFPLLSRGNELLGAIVFLKPKPNDNLWV